MYIDDAWDLYNAVRLHFTSHYDFFKYNGKTGRKIKMRNGVEKIISVIIHKYPSHSELLWYYIANFVRSQKEIRWYGEMKDEPYHNVRKYYGNVIRSFKEDLEKIDVYKSIRPVGRVPKILAYIDMGRVREETVCILRKVFMDGQGDDLYDLYAKSFKYDMLVQKQVSILRSYQPFVEENIDESVIENVVSVVMTNFNQHS